MTRLGQRPIVAGSVAALLLAWGYPLLAQQPRPPAPAVMSSPVPRTADGRPDLQGFWSNATQTPLERPEELGGKEFFTEAEAAEYERTALDRLLEFLGPEERLLGADLNYTYMDFHRVGENRRTSLIVDPANGRIPKPLPQAEKRAAARPESSSDDPELVGLDERCLVPVSFGTSNSSPPIVPNTFGQNLYQVVQTPRYVMIFSELVHDARIIRIGGKHPPSKVQHWLGDSIGRWDGDTLVVDTTNFSAKTHFRGSSERFHVVERFSRTDQHTIQYRFTVDDPDTWATSWTAEIPFKATDQRMFEYACHEANYAMTGILRGARVAEREAANTQKQKQ
jgi:hypothetical protein